ncbi:MAG: recombinase family protein [Paracoccaceae bacterium]
MTYRTNKLVHYQNDKYSDDQKRTYESIKSLHDEGWGYRRITKHLNDKGILTHTGKTWGETGNSVYSVLKQYKEREKRLELINTEYEPVRGKMEIRSYPKTTLR